MTSDKKWIELEEEYPPENLVVLCADSVSGCVTIGFHNPENEESFDCVSLNGLEIDFEPTHWMPFPDPPIFNEEDYE